MVERQRLAGDSAEPREERCIFSAGTTLDMPMQGKRNIKTSEAVTLHAPAHYRGLSGTSKPAGSLEKQACKKHKGGPSSAEIRLIEKYLQTARPIEEGIDEEALHNFVKSSTFKKFVQRVELEDEVFELQQQLEQEIQFHTSLERVLSHTSRTLPDSVLHDLPINVQRLLSDIAMLEVAVLRLETQATALQWELVHEKTEREVIEHHLNFPLDVSLPVSFSPTRPTQISHDLTQLPSSFEAQLLSSPKFKFPDTSSPTHVTLKELLHTPPQGSEQQCWTQPKSPRRSLQSLWSALDGLPESSLPSFSKKIDMKDRSRIFYYTLQERDQHSPTVLRTGALTSEPSFDFSFSASPLTPSDQPRPATPVSPRCQSSPDAVPRENSNTTKLLPSGKRLAFWNYASDDEDASSEFVITATEVVQHPLSLPDEFLFAQQKSTVDMRRRRKADSRAMQGPSQSPLSPLDNSTTTTSTSSSSQDSDTSLRSPRQRYQESPVDRRRVDVEALLVHFDLAFDANRLSEEMVRCMVDVYCHLAEPHGEPPASSECPLSPSSHTDRLSNSSMSSSSESSLSPAAESSRMYPGRYGEVIGCESSPDPYRSMGKLPWDDIGPYADVFEVPWLSVGKDQLEYVAHSLGRFRLLVEQLTKVNPLKMTHDQKLAFWINLYNALLMHAFLAYGIPRSDLRFFTLMQKAAYCVGGHWFNAAVIECNLLKAKVMSHRPQFALMMALHKNKLTEEQSKYGIDRCEAKVNFALSCGVHSSPMVRIYTPEQIHDELDFAFCDYVRATVGMTAKGKLLIPKLVYNYARELIDDNSILELVCRYLPIRQVTFIYECIQQRQRRRLFSASNFVIVPFSFAFRYLFPRGISNAIHSAEVHESSSAKKPLLFYT